MTQFVPMSTDDITAIYTAPFGPERGYIYDVTMMAHWLELQMEPGTVIVPFAAEPFAAVQERATPALSAAQWSVLATSATLDALLTRQQVALRLDPPAAKAVTATNAADLATFADGMLASPPGCEVLPVPARTIVLVINGHVVVIPIPPNPEPDPLAAKELRKQELLAVAVRLQAAATSTAAGELEPALRSAAERLFEAAVTRG